ncbi:hypothetical protein BTR23_07395 [Alkalihalophilus pseudofirmus]|nr:hypothetical protein BTR23_07395 [Alkalihalophilus pseudofirmus]
MNEKKTNIGSYEATISIDCDQAMEELQAFREQMEKCNEELKEVGKRLDAMLEKQKEMGWHD